MLTLTTLEGTVTNPRNADPNRVAESSASALRGAFARLFHASPPLTLVGLAMLDAFALSVLGLVLDPRVVAGAPVWLKPAKFAISSAIYALTFAWLFTYLPAWPRLTKGVGWTTAAVLVLEVGLIDLQAGRGLSSHFNVATALDGAIFAVMGTAILIAWAGSIVLAVALFRQRFGDPVLGWAMRLGLVITVIGSATGGLMTRPTAAQLADVRAGRGMPFAGAHTVGGPDGGPGLAGTGWSLEHGDIRVAHFVGLHAVQVLPLVAFALRRVRSEARRRRAVLAAAASYASLFAILLLQALSAQPVVAPAGVFGTALVVWLLATAIAAAAVAAAPPRVAGSGARHLVVS
jgi:hypothetical protein